MRLRSAVQFAGKPFCIGAKSGIHEENHQHGNSHQKTAKVTDTQFE